MSDPSTLVGSSPVGRLAQPRIDRKRRLVGEVPEEAKFDSMLGMVRVADLVVDEEYQRSVEPRKVATIANDFDPDAFGTIIVSKRGDGTLAVIDGGHRVAALHLMGWGDQQVPAEIHTGLTQKEEARVFTKSNGNRSAVRAQDMHRAKVVAADPEAEGIQAILDKHHVPVVKMAHEPGLRAIASARKVYRAENGSSVLDRTIGILVKAYGITIETFTADLLKGLGSLIAVRPEARDDRLTKALADLGEPGFIVNRGKAVATVSETKTRNEVANLIIRAYNSGLAKGRLAEVDTTTDLIKAKR